MYILEDQDFFDPEKQQFFFSQQRYLGIYIL